MKFRDHKTGEVFDVEREGATGGFCARIDCYSNCPLPECAKVEDCSDWINAHPAEAARLMGYEVVVDKEELMENKDKPRICDVLGVEVGEKFTYPGMIGEFWVTENGHLRSVVEGDDKLMICIPALINHPDRIIRKPRFTEEEAAFIRRIPAAKYISRDLISNGESTVDFWTGAPDHTGGVFVGQRVAMVPADFVPTLRPGQAVKLEEIINATDG